MPSKRIGYNSDSHKLQPIRHQNAATATALISSEHGKEEQTKLFVGGLQSGQPFLVNPFSSTLSRQPFLVHIRGRPQTN